MKKILGLLIALMISTKAFASITIMPTKVELNANKTKANYVSTSIEVRGDERQVMRFKAYTGYFTINELGQMNQIAESTAPNNIAKKIKFVPSEFTVLPGKSQKVRLNIVNINTLPDGENRCVIYIEDVNPKEVPVDTGRAGIGAQLIVKTRVAVPVYLDKGKFTRIGEFENFSVKNEKGAYYVTGKLLNKGNSRLRYTVHEQIIKDKKLVKEQALGGGTVGDNNYNNVLTKLDLKDVPGGNYTLRYIIRYKDEKGKVQNIKQETEISI